MYYRFSMVFFPTYIYDIIYTQSVVYASAKLNILTIVYKTKSYTWNILTIYSNRLIYTF